MPSVGSGPSKAEQKRWQAEDDLRTLVEAEKIKKDKDRLREAKKMAGEQRAALGEISKS